mmetsp:Transcript_139076/g.361363  ORF Transcript_139076/g.361363 Transcript_139076/m.361363 type:complete len:967 (-) Transcript_139076:170-3070(-)
MPRSEMLFSKNFGPNRPSAGDNEGRVASNHSAPNSRKAFRAEHSLGVTKDPKKEPKYKTLSRKIVENGVFVSLTMLLTIYALVGDDFRLLWTHKSADSTFDYMVVTCIFIFSFECIISVLGKADYLWSFFFWLDMISTVSLVLDITVVSEWMLNAIRSDEDGAEGAGEVRGGRAAKIGAKAGRVVRVLRLVRILKLYKAYYEAKAREKKKRMEAAKRPGDDDDWDDEDLDEDKAKLDSETDKESHVGRKLSEMTTRRVICLILAMLLGLPMLQAEQADQAAFSAEYGSEHVWQSFYGLTLASSSASARSTYEVALLRYIYYHNWFARADPAVYCPMGDCAGEYLAQLFWVGVQGEDIAIVRENAQLGPVINQEPAEFELHYKSIDGLYNLGLLPQQAQNMLKSSWTARCDTNSFATVGFSLLAEEIDDVVTHTVECPSDLRLQEHMYVSPRLMMREQFDDLHMAFYFDLRPFVKMDALYNLINTFNILVLLIVVSLMFSSDANRLIVNPVERMIKRVEAIRDDPLIAMKMADEEFKAEEVAKARKKRAKKEYAKFLLSELASGNFCGSGQNAPMETVILEKTIIKLGSLLALGFGEAGANIIGHNMKGGDSAGVNAMIAGSRVECIIGVVRIRDFSTATEVLQSKIMTFVNQVAEIVHGVVNEFQGAPNRNSGESFLVIWRTEANFDLNVPTATREKAASKLAGCSVVAFVKIVGGLHRSPLLATYRGHPGLQYRLGANCRVNLSFGLHAGWAIEGAVGSEFKIDASYLSPNVSIATSVERATQTYGVSLMVAQSVVELCPQSVVSKCRLIDRVVITGSSQPMEVYCVDLDYRAVSVDTAEPLKIVWNTRNRFKVRQFLESEKAAMESDSFDFAEVFDGDPTIRDMRKRYTVEFFQLFNMGYQNYAQGEWQVARRMLSCTRAILGTEDGPSSALLRHMEIPYQFEAPRDWQGVRDLVTAVVAADAN